MAGDRYVTAQTLEARCAAWLAAVKPYSRGRPALALDRAALLVVDVQRHFSEPASPAHLPALAAVLPNIMRLVSAFRDAGRPVVMTRHGRQPGSAEDQMTRWWGGSVMAGDAAHALAPELSRAPSDLVLDKDQYSAFAGTDLRDWLRARGCDAVVVCGVMTHLCCETSARDAFMAGLQVGVVADATASRDEDLHLGALRAMAHGVAAVHETRWFLGALGQDPGRPREKAPPPAPERADLAVVGAGPTGLAAAIQAVRAGVDTALLDAHGPGGWARSARAIENYPGFPGGISGRALAGRIEAQAGQWGIAPALARVEAIAPAPRGEGYRLTLQGDASLTARAVILATGTRPRGLGIALPDDARVVHRADQLPPGPGAELLVVGGGEASLDQALLARLRLGMQVTLCVRGPRVTAMELLRRRCREAGVRFITDARVVAVEADKAGLEVCLEQGGSRASRRVDALLVCVGKEPLLPQLPRSVALDAAGAPRADALGRTSAPGLYAAGDLRRGRYRQVSIAVGDGVVAAMHATRYLKGCPWKDPEP